MRAFHLGGLLILPYSVGCNGGGKLCLWPACKERSWKGIAVSPRFLTFIANSAPPLSDSLSNGLALRPSLPGLPRTYLTRCEQHVHHTWNRVFFKKITKIKINRNQVREKKKKNGESYQAQGSSGITSSSHTLSGLLTQLLVLASSSLTSIAPERPHPKASFQSRKIICIEFWGRARSAPKSQFGQWSCWRG